MASSNSYEQIEIARLGDAISKSESTDERHQIALAIRRLGIRGIEWVREQVTRGPAPDLVPTVVFAMSSPFIQEGWAYDYLIRMLSSPDPTIVFETVEALRRAQVDLAGDMIALYESPDPLVRGAVLRMIVGRRPDADDYIRKALNDESYLVRESAVDLIDEQCLVQYIGDLHQLLNDEHEDVREAALTAVRNLRENDEK